jgi:hypothetical protein
MILISDFKVRVLRSLRRNLNLTFFRCRPLNWLLSHLTVRNDTIQIIIRSRFLAISSCEPPSRRGAAADVSLFSVLVHLNDEAPFSFKVTLPESSTLVSEPALNLEEGAASCV